MKNTILVVLIIFILGLSGVSIWYITQPTQSQTQSSLTEPTTVPVSKTYTLADISTHNSASDCWLVISNKVYNVTTFIPDHPGGQEILKGCGRDATQLFSGEREHAENNASALLPTYYIGDISQ